MKALSANSSPAFEGRWLIEQITYVLLFVAAAASTCVEPLAGIAVGIGICIGLAFIGRMQAAVLFFVALIPFDAQIPSGASQTLYIDLFFGVLAFPILVEIIRRKACLNYRALVWLPFLVYSLGTTISRSNDVKWLLESALRFAILLIFAEATALYGDGTKTIVILGWVTVPVVLYGFYQLISGGLGPVFMFMSGTSTDEAMDTAGRQFLTGRAYGFFIHPNTLGSFSAVVAVALLAVAGRTENKATSAKCYVLASVAFIGAVSSGSRGALMALGVAIFVLLGLSGKKGAIRIAVGVGIIIAVFAIANQFDLLPVSRETSIDEFTRESRLAVWGQALLLFLQHPMIGSGWLNFHSIGVFGDTQFGSVNHAHSWYLNTLVESGVVGFVLLVGPVVWLLIRNMRVARHNQTALIVSVSLTVILVHNVVDVIVLSSPQFGLLTGALIGLAAQTESAAARSSKNRPELNRESVHPA
jgi:hypothetical protein